MSTIQKTGMTVQDGNNKAIPVPSGVQYIDGTASPQISPKSVTIYSGTTTAFVPPNNSLTFIFKASGTCRYGDNATLSGASATTAYKIAATNAEVVLPCSNGNTIYLGGDAGTVTVDFMFEIL